MKRIYQSLKPRLATFLLRSGGRLIDLEWYRGKNLQSPFWHRFAILHALLLGHRAEIQSHPLFSPEYFAGQCRIAGLAVPKKPLPTYLRNAMYWDINPHPLFDAGFYKQQLQDTLDQSPLMHFLRGGHLKHDPHPLFQRNWYLISYPGLKNMPQHCAISHYIKIGYKALTSTHPLFHAAYYAGQSGIPVNDGNATEDALLHFVQSDSTTTSCHPIFSVPHFLSQIETENHFKNSYSVIKNYIENSENWKFNTHILFDAEFYLSQSENSEQQAPPLQEYIGKTFKSRNPHPLFNNRWYTERKKNIKEFKGQIRNPLVHFLLHGHQMGESPHPLFALQWYRHTYMQGRMDNINPLIDFLTQGESKGNRPNPLYPDNWQHTLYEKHGCKTLSDFSRKSPTDFPSFRNRISDNFFVQNLSRKAEVPASTKDYIIFFTPRSGSSWLTDLVKKQSILGQPSEWFNPDLMQPAMNSFSRPCRNIHEYCDNLREKHKSAEGFFGSEITGTHLSLLRQLADFNTLFRDPSYVIQLRKNIVLQAISLYLATETGFFHATNTINQENEAQYKPVKIKKWLSEILREEKYLANFLHSISRHYHVSWYEDLQSNPTASLQQIMQHITGHAPAIIHDSPSEYRKIRSSINTEYEMQFRTEYPDFVAAIEAARPFSCS